jgi:Uma2 family endonuclease
MTTAAGLMTFTDFERLPEPPSGYYELHHGQPVLMPPRKKTHMMIQQVLIDLLRPLVADQGFMTSEFAFQPTSEYESWQADVGFVSQARWNLDQNEYVFGCAGFGHRSSVTKQHDGRSIGPTEHLPQEWLHCVLDCGP